MKTDEKPIGYYLKSISDRCRVFGDAAFQKKGLTGTQAQYLEYIFRMGRATTQKQLEVFFGVSHPTVNGVIHRLEEKGFVTVRIDPHCRRNRIVTLTNRAVEAMGDLTRGKLETDRKILQGFSEAEVRQLRQYLARIYENLSVPPETAAEDLPGYRKQEDGKEAAFV